MGADVFKIKQRSLRPSLRQYLVDGDGHPFALTGATVRFQMGHPGDPARVNAAAVVEDVATALVRYDWVDGDTDVVGTYKGLWRVVYGDNTPELVPSDGYVTVVVEA